MLMVITKAVVVVNSLHSCHGMVKMLVVMRATGMTNLTYTHTHTHTARTHMCTHSEVHVYFDMQYMNDCIKIITMASVLYISVSRGSSQTNTITTQKLMITQYSTSTYMYIYTDTYTGTVESSCGKALPLLPCTLRAAFLAQHGDS